MDALLSRLKEIINLRHYSKRTESSYVNWVRRFLSYHQQIGLSKAPSKEDVKGYLTRLAMVDHVVLKCVSFCH